MNMAAKQSAGELRAKRDQIGEQVEALRAKMKMLAAQIREAEGPVPDRSGRPAKDAGFTIRPA